MLEVGGEGVLIKGCPVYIWAYGVFGECLLLLLPDVVVKVHACLCACLLSCFTHLYTHTHTHMAYGASCNNDRIVHSWP
jgi:hypothetical protein